MVPPREHDFLVESVQGPALTPVPRSRSGSASTGLSSRLGEIDFRYKTIFAENRIPARVWHPDAALPPLPALSFPAISLRIREKEIDFRRSPIVSRAPRGAPTTTPGTAEEISPAVAVDRWLRPSGAAPREGCSQRLRNSTARGAKSVWYWKMPPWPESG
jgi:hypothetical protein